MSPPLSLAVPLRKKPDADSFDTRPEAVQRWLAELPLGHTGETARHLYRALYEVNRLDIDIQHRLNFHEQLNVPLQGVLDALKPHYQGKPLPLQPKAEKVVQLALELHAAMVIGYQLVMLQSDNKLWLSHRKWEEVWTTAVARMLHYMNGIASVHFLVSRPLPSGFFHMIHNAYRLLEENNLLRAEVPGLQEEGSDTLGHAYKQMLLMSMLPQQRMRASQLSEVCKLMHVWTENLSISKPTDLDSCKQTWCIDLDLDHRPASHWKLLKGRTPNLHSLRTLRMDSLLEQIKTQLDKGHKVLSKISLPGEQSLSRDLAVLLLESWQQPPERGDRRQAAHGTLHLVLGMQAIHTLLSEVMGVAAGSTQTPASKPETQHKAEQKDEPVIDLAAIRDLEIEGGLDDTKLSFAHSLGFVGDKEEEADVWGMVYAAKAPKQTTAWTSVKVSKSYTLMQAGLIDQSSGGMGLRLPVVQNSGVRVGELIAYSLSETVGEWQLGMVRWLRADKPGEMVLGIKSLQESCSPASIYVEHAGKRSEPFDCLLGHQDNQLRLVLPQMTGLGNKHILLNFGGREVPISLLEVLETSPVFQMYRCVENQARKDEKAGRPANSDPFDKYKNMWDIL
jgi:hypothetical protein